ncbi:hypothetical protein Q2941_44505 [Bradyrhizobium sp. UFLA05-153]
MTTYRMASITALLVFAITMAATISEAAPCFAPLADRNSRNPDNFKDLAKNTAATAQKGVKRFLPLISADTKLVNIDFYYINFTQPKTGTVESLFKRLRLNFNTFAEGTSKDFGFGAYAASDDANDSIRKTNEKLWNQDVPLKALMSFGLDTLWPATSFGAAARYIKDKHGDLQVTCATKTDFVFSTVQSERGGDHPVSGNRGFGLTDNLDGTWTFYSKAVDRKTDNGENWLATTIFRKDVFCLGHQFWLLFYSDMKTYLEQQKDLSIKVKEIWTGNHGPAPYPFQNGAESKTYECK